MTKAIRKKNQKQRFVITFIDFKIMFIAGRISSKISLFTGQVGTSQELGEAYYQWYEYKDKFDEEKRARKEEARQRQAEGSVPYDTSGPSTSRGVGNVTEHMQSMHLRDGQ